MRLIDADAMEKQAYDDVHYHAELEDWEFDVVTHYLDHAPTIDAVPVARLEQVKNEILARMGEFIKEYRFYSESTVDHFGGKADAMDVAKRLVKAALTDLCLSYGERKDGEG